MKDVVVQFYWSAGKSLVTFKKCLSFVGSLSRFAFHTRFDCQNVARRMETLCNSCVILDSKHRNGTGKKSESHGYLFHRICLARRGGRSMGAHGPTIAGGKLVRRVRVHRGAGAECRGQRAVGFFRTDDGWCVPSRARSAKTRAKSWFKKKGQSLAPGP